MAWEVEYTDEFGDWWETLDADEQVLVATAMEVLAEVGPALGRPFVDTIQGSKHANMKELRPLFGTIRVLFAFDPRRTALVLIGGDKTNRWSDWYRVMIPIADRLYDEPLAELRRGNGN